MRHYEICEQGKFNYCLNYAMQGGIALRSKRAMCRNCKGWIDCASSDFVPPEIYGKPVPICRIDDNGVIREI
jgi:hypothetical protein